MKATVSPTAIITEIDGVPVRLWNGTTESGALLTLAVHRVTTDDPDLQRWLERNLTVALAPLDDELVVVAAVELARQWEGGEAQ